MQGLRDVIRSRLAQPRYAKIYRAYLFAKVNAWSLAVGLGICFAVGVSFFIRERIAGHLVRLDPAILSQLGTAVGAALIGLIAVVFTLSLFVIQQVSERAVPGLLREYAADTRSKLIYFLLSIAAVSSLGASLILPARHPVALIAIVASSTILSLSLLRVLFARVAFLCDPASIILHVWTSGAKEVRRLDTVQQELVRYNPDLARAESNVDASLNDVNMATAALYSKFPFLTRKLQQSLRHLHALMRHFASTQQYDLLDDAIKAATDLLGKYVAVRGSSLVLANSFMIDTEVGFDPVLIASLEVFGSLLRSSIESRDSEASRAIILGLQRFAASSVNHPSLAAPQGENPTTGLILGYMLPAAKQSVGRGNQDALLAMNDALLAIASELIKGRFYLTAVWMIGEWSQTASLALMAQQCIAATDATKNLLKLLEHMVTLSIEWGHLPESIRDALFAICGVEIDLDTVGTHPRPLRGLVPDTPLRQVLSGTGSVSFLSIHTLLVNRIADSVTSRNYEQWRSLRSILETLDDDLCQRLVKLGEASAGKDQFTLFYLDETARQVACHLVWLWQWHRNAEAGPPDISTIEESDLRVAAAQWAHAQERFQEKLEEVAHWLSIGFYSRCRGFQAEGVRSRRIRECFNSVVSIATRAALSEMDSLAVDIVRMVESSAAAILKEGGVGSVTDACRIISRLVDVSLVASITGAQSVIDAVEAVLQTTYKRAVSLIVEGDPQALHAATDPAQLLLKRIAELADPNGSYLMMVDEKSKDVLENVPLEVTEAYREKLQQLLDAWGTELADAGGSNL